MLIFLVIVLILQLLNDRFFGMLSPLSAVLRLLFILNIIPRFITMIVTLMIS